VLILFSKGLTIKEDGVSLIDVDDSVKPYIVDNTITGKTLAMLHTKKHNKNKLCIFHTIKASSGEFRRSN
jgi:hypothetical protein